MYKLLTLTALLTLVACTPHTVQKHDIVLPSELSHCSVYEMSDSTGTKLKVVYCPNASTTTSHKSGKVRKSTTVISE